MKPKTVWILVADASHAFIAERCGAGSALEKDVVAEFRAPNVPNREIMSDAPGRTFDRSGPARHAMEQHTDPQRHRQHVLAQEIAEQLGAAARRNAFDQLVIVAAPRMLGELRGCLSETTRARVVEEVPKTLTHLPLQELPEHLPQSIGI